MFTLPFFEHLSHAKNVLLAGAGGGYDLFSGLPLYFLLRNAGKTVHLANLSFSTLYASTGTRRGEALVEVTAQTEGSLRYFPELHLCRWFKEKRDETVSIFCLDRVGVRPVTTAYQNLLAHLGDIDTVLLIDGGTDSLMRGDEPGLGTPEEDMASLCAVHSLPDNVQKLLVCLGFGVDTFHHVCHAYFLEAVAELTRTGGYLGAWSLLPQMPEVHATQDAVNFVHKIMFNHPSIVSSSVLSAIEGQFGDYHATRRTEGSTLFINPLMGLYWAFDVNAVLSRNLYHERIRKTETWQDVQTEILKYRAENKMAERPWIDLPM